MTAPAGRGKGAEKAQATRDSLVRLAAEMFAEQGYVQTSIRDVARRGALTTGAIYGHFRNKADLLAAAINTRTAEELEAASMGVGEDLDYIEVVTRLGRDFPKRRQLRALIVQGAAAAQRDDETRTRLREEQLAHIDTWIKGYEHERDRLGIDPSVDIHAAVLTNWAMELGLGVLEGMGIEPRSRKGWADMQNRLARSWQLPPDEQDRKPPKKIGRRPRR